MPFISPQTQRILQEYLQALAEVETQPLPRRARHLLTSYAEFSFRLRGGSRCPMCHAHVRHVLPVRVFQKDGTETTYSCLCYRCIEGERGNAEAVEIALGDAKWQLKAPAN